ncbi:phospholipid/cholesterol/gamma-HCH transport system permease protein [Rhodothalassium salexigens DSM 2132]|uniref:Phospholipid/cholesterol/gamma-HCH transport system permease protein n=1 Tax=Rhodothalassium salexigens DSM 2132 TaxID=1188247 RepID=A0A4R2PLF5_RHOSA|nr:MlaE family lipid ABC transporter permease subunit [Rhodothalassium salexigens]MBB4210912.1 phospholipid/cholesterol/gamma-HCH transport system permease protein [Rhodothalassium salexigens DSM 2132]TCP36430.1 phospholipid/cholesterol/gamma-HCH transport system permease protein [Rhodothalassium salexigens DSM 2132]
MDSPAPNSQQTPWVRVHMGAAALGLEVGGDWTVDTANTLERLLADVRPGTQDRVEADLSAVTAMDTVGAWLLHRTGQRLSASGLSVDATGLSPRYRALLDQVQRNDRTCEVAPPEGNAFVRLLEEIGVGTVNALTTFGQFLSFLGLVMVRFASVPLHPRRLRINALVHQMEMVGLRATPIVALIVFLIGAVVVNQGAIQLRQFGAEVMVVNLLAISVLRELGPMLAAIMVAGRSGSAFTAQIGSMVLREEVDAMRTLGLNPIDVLVLPRMLALGIMLPLLTFLADLLGLLGGMILGWATLGITPAIFMTQLLEAVSLRTLAVGLIKAPFFAVIIATSGCFYGMTVGGSADSVGRNTTAAVVQSIFMVIVLDALFALFFSAIGWS